LELGLRILPVGRVRTDDLLYFGQSRRASCKSNSGQLGASDCKDKALQISAAGTALPEADISNCAVVWAVSIWGHTVRSNPGSKFWVSSIKSSRQIEDNVQFKASFFHPSQAIWKPKKKFCQKKCIKKKVAVTWENYTCHYIKG
jgi:hypothetical protein